MTPPSEPIERSLVEALWWYIENVSEENQDRHRRLHRLLFDLQDYCRQTGFVLTPPRPRSEKPTPRQRAETSGQVLIRDLWSFIVNSPAEGSELTERFFALRGRVRSYYGTQERT